MKYFLRLPFPLKRVVFSAALMAPRIKRRVQRHGYEATTRWLAARRKPVVTEAKDAIAIASIAQLTTVRVPGSYNCLTRSLLVWWLVGGDNSAHIRFGVIPDDGSGFNFHAWVEKEGVVINDAADVASHYTPFTMPLPSAIKFD